MSGELPLLADFSHQSGELRYYSRRPGEQWSGWARANLEDWRSTKFEDAIDGPVTESLGIRGATLKTDADG